MKLSQKSSENFRNNLHKIAALNGNRCMIGELSRRYEDGTICAGMACLSESEQDVAAEDNVGTMSSYARRNNFSADDTFIINELENIHDDVMLGDTLVSALLQSIGKYLA